MIITTSDIRSIRSIALNIDDIDRIQPYIKDAEILDVLPRITATVYKALDQTTWTEQTLVTILNDQGQPITMDYSQYTDLMNGCYYTLTNPRCNQTTEHYSGGLIAATAYLAYARLLPNHNINVTAFGLKLKLGEFSQPIAEADMTKAANEARNIGLEYLDQCVCWLESKRYLTHQTPTKRFRKFHSIG